MQVTKQILIIDAEPTVRTVISKILSRAGYAVQQAQDLPCALNCLAAMHVDLVITNVYLPGITGHDAVQALKDKSGSAPILMVSGLPDNEVIDQWQNEQGWDVFPKPFAAEALVRKVQETLTDTN